MYKYAIVPVYKLLHASAAAQCILELEHDVLSDSVVWRSHAYNVASYWTMLKLDAINIRRQWSTRILRPSTMSLDSEEDLDINYNRWHATSGSCATWVRVYTVFSFFVFKFANEKRITNSFFVFKVEKRIRFSFFVFAFRLLRSHWQRFENKLAEIASVKWYI